MLKKYQGLIYLCQVFGQLGAEWESIGNHITGPGTAKKLDCKLKRFLLDLDTDTFSTERYIVPRARALYENKYKMKCETKTQHKQTTNTMSNDNKCNPFQDMAALLQCYMYCMLYTLYLSSKQGRDTNINCEDLCYSLQWNYFLSPYNCYYFEAPVEHSAPCLGAV